MSLTKADRERLLAVLAEKRADDNVKGYAEDASMKWWHPVVILGSMGILALGSWAVLVMVVILTMRAMGVID